MKKLHFIPLLFLFLISTASFAQVTVNFNSATFPSGTVVSNCNTIDLGTTNSVTLNLSLNLQKAVNNAVGTSTISIYKKSINSQFDMELAVLQTITQATWTTWNGTSIIDLTLPFTLNASQFNLTGDKIYAVLETSSEVKYSSCEYAIERALPITFRLTPSSTNISCNSTDPITFSVTNVNNSPGTLSYIWNVGSGWTGTNGNPVSGTFTSNSNSITLIPNQYPPSNIGVTPVLDNQNRPSLTSSTTLANFTSNAFVIGTPSLCSGSSTFTISPLASNETVAWSVSDPNIVTMNVISPTEVVLQVIGQGEINLIATITNSCGQTDTKNRKVAIGKPFIISPNCLDNPFVADDEDCIQIMCRTYYYNSDNRIEAKATGMNTITGWQWQRLTNNYSWVTYNNIANIQPNQYGSIVFQVRAQSACGWSDWAPHQIIVPRNCSDSGENGEGFEESSEFGMFNTSNTNLFNLYPNPVSSVLYLELANLQQPKIDSKISAELIDLFGFSKKQVRIENYQATIDVSNLPKGTYVLRIIIDDQVESHQVVVE